MFCKSGVHRNFAKSTGKHLCQSLFFNEVAGMKPSTLLKKRLWHSIQRHDITLKVKSHGILHYLSLMTVSKFIFCQYFFSGFCQVEKCGVTTHCLYSLVPNCRREGRGRGDLSQIAIFWEKKLSTPFNYYKRMDLKTPSLDNFPPGAFCLIPALYS